MSKGFPIKDIINYENHIGWDLITPDGKYIRFSDNIEHKPFVYDEIKEILDNVKECCDITKDQNFVVYQRQDILKLLDYVTSLQKTIELVIDIDTKHMDRIDKAREYINSDTHLEGWINIEHYGEREQDLLNILNGGDKYE